MEDAEDSEKTESGIYTFIDWIENGKLEIRAYPSEKIHAKVYIMTFGEGDRDKGRVITGSSNFTLCQSEICRDDPHKTWLNDTITPYELYLKFLYEYFKDDLSQHDENLE